LPIYFFIEKAREALELLLERFAYFVCLCSVASDF